MTAVRLREGDPPVERELPSGVGELLADSGVVSVSRGVLPGSWQLTAASKVGVVRLGEVEVWIEPKIDIRRLVFLLGYARSPQGWRDADVPLQAAPELLPAIAHALARQADRALQQGVLQGYRQVEDSLPVLRGRVREADQLRRRYGVPVPLEVRYDEFTVDIAENRILRAAIERLLRLPRVPLDVRRTLRRLLLLKLVDVSGLPDGAPPPSWYATRLNARYHVVLRLAEVVLSAQSFEQRRGDLRVSGFLFDLARVFEDFVCVALREVLAPYGGRVELQHSTYLDVGEAVRMRPDLVWLRRGDPVAVVDAKYKAERPAGFPDADLYQLLAYCTALRLATGHLVYARGNERPVTYKVKHAGVELQCHALDLGVDPLDLLGQVAAIGRDIGGYRTGAGQG